VTGYLCHRLDAPPASRGQHCANTEQGRTPASRSTGGWSLKDTVFLGVAQQALEAAEAARKAEAAKVAEKLVRKQVCTMHARCMRDVRCMMRETCIVHRACAYA
jgi:hypothetical protein